MTPGNSWASFSRSFLSSRATSLTLSKKPFFVITSKTALPTLHASGLPPNVEPCEPKSICLPTFFEVKQAPRGKPFPIAFAIVMISGLTSVH